MAGGFAALRAEAAGHPLPRAEEAFEQGREIEVGIELGEIDTEAGWGDLDGGELGGSCRFKALRDGRREGKIYAGGELENDAADAAVVAGGDGARE